MAQRLKDHVQEQIADAAVRVFARHGYAGATMAGIAAAAGISTGNVYRYYADKRHLFDAVVGDEFVRTFTRLLRRRVQSLDGVKDVRTLDATAVYRLTSETLLHFCIERRLRVVILLARAHGSRHEGFREQTVRELIRLAIAHFRGLNPDLQVTRAMRFALTQIYRHFVDTLVAALVEHEDPRLIRQIVEGYTTYHLAGLKQFFEGTLSPGGASARARTRKGGAR